MAEAENKKTTAPEGKAKKEKDSGSGVASLGANILKMSIVMGGLSILTKGLLSPIKALTSLPGLGKKLISGFGGLVKAFSGLDISLKNVGKALSSGLAAADKMNERALGMGKTLGGFQTAFAGQLDKMPGVLSQRLGTTMDMFAGGLRGNTAQVAKLAQLQKLSGKDSKATIAAFSDLQSSMGVTNAGLNAMANATIKAQYTYGVNAEKIVGAMNALSQETKDVGLMEGLGAEFAGAVGEITGMLGGKGEKELSKIFAVLTGGAEMDAEATRLGIRAQRESITSSSSQADIVAAALSAIQTADKTAKSWQSNLSGLRQIGRRTEVLKNQLGESVTAFTGLNNMLELEKKSKAKGMEQGLNILGTLKQQALALWAPISNLWLEEGAKLYHMIVANATEIGIAFRAYIVAPIKDIVGGFTKSMLENGNLMDGIKTIFKAVGRVVTWVAKTLGGTFGDGGSMYDKVVGFFTGVLLKIAQGFDDFVLGALPKIELAFLSVAVAIMKGLNKIPGIDVSESTIATLDSRRQEAKLRSMSPEDVDALVTGITRGKDEFGSKYDVGGAMAGAAVGAAIGSIIPGVGTIVGGVGGLLVGAIGGWFAGDKVEEAIEGSMGKFWITHPITGAEESFKTHDEAAVRGKQIQDEVRAMVKERRDSMSMTDRVNALQEKMLHKEEKSVDNQLDYLAALVEPIEDIADNTAPVEEALEITPGTDFQTSMGDMLSQSILSVLKGGEQEAAVVEQSELMREMLIELQGTRVGIGHQVAIAQQLTARGGHK